MKNASLSAMAVLVLATAGGCPRRQPAPDWGPYACAEEVLRAARRQRQEISSLRATAVVTVQRGSRRTKMRAALAVRRPADLRLECESFFGQPLWVLVSDGFSYQLWRAEDGTVGRGQATAQEMMQLLSLPLDGVELVGTMLGEPPLIAWASSSLARDGRRRRWQIELSNSRQPQSLALDAESLFPLALSTWEERRLLYRVTLEAQKGEGALPLPREIYFRMPAQDIGVQIRLRELELNPPIDEAVFSLATGKPSP